MPIHLYLGDDLYSMGRALENVRKEGGFEEVDVMRLDARQMNTQDLLMAIATPGLFSTKRLAILEGLGEQAKAGRKGATKSRESDQALTIDSLASCVPESTTVVVIGSVLRSDAALVKEAKHLARSKDREVEVREFSAPRQRDMPRWIAQRAREQGIKIDGHAAEQLALRVGEQVSVAGTELQKLATAAGPGGVVGADLVNELVPQTAEESIFPLIEAVAAGRKDAALRLLERQLKHSTGNQTDVSLPLIRLLARQFRLLLQIRLMLSEGRKRQEIIGTLKISEYYADRYFGQARRFSDAQLTAALERLVAGEQAIKTGEAPEAFLQLLLVDLTGVASSRA